MTTDPSMITGMHSPEDTSEETRELPRFSFAESDNGLSKVWNEAVQRNGLLSVAEFVSAENSALQKAYKDAYERAERMEITDVAAVIDETIDNVESFLHKNIDSILNLMPEERDQHASEDWLQKILANLVIFGHLNFLNVVDPAEGINRYNQQILETIRREVVPLLGPGTHVSVGIAEGVKIEAPFNQLSVASSLLRQVVAGADPDYALALLHRFGPFVDQEALQQMIYGWLLQDSYKDICEIAIEQERIHRNPDEETYKAGWEDEMAADMRGAISWRTDLGKTFFSDRFDRDFSGTVWDVVKGRMPFMERFSPDVFVAFVRSGLPLDLNRDIHLLNEIWRKDPDHQGMKDLLDILFTKATHNGDRDAMQSFFTSTEVWDKLAKGHGPAQDWLLAKFNHYCQENPKAGRALAKSCLAKGLQEFAVPAYSNGRVDVFEAEFSAASFQRSLRVLLASDAGKKAIAQIVKKLVEGDHEKREDVSIVLNRWGLLLFAGLRGSTRLIDPKTGQRVSLRKLFAKYAGKNAGVMALMLNMVDDVRAHFPNGPLLNAVLATVLYHASGSTYHDLRIRPDVGVKVLYGICQRVAVEKWRQIPPFVCPRDFTMGENWRKGWEDESVHNTRRFRRWTGEGLRYRLGHHWRRTRTRA